MLAHLRMLPVLSPVLKPTDFAVRKRAAAMGIVNGIGNLGNLCVVYSFSDKDSHNPSSIESDLTLGNLSGVLDTIHPWVSPSEPWLLAPFLRLVRSIPRFLDLDIPLIFHRLAPTLCSRQCKNGPGREGVVGCSRQTSSRRGRASGGHNFRAGARETERVPVLVLIPSYQKLIIPYKRTCKYAKPIAYCRVKLCIVE